MQSSEQRAEPVPVVAGRFELYDRVGRGGMGTVWRAFDRKQQRWVAAKMLTHTDASIVLRFVREQSLRIVHPNVATPIGWAADDDRVVLSMELIRGGSVETLRGDQGALPEPYVAVLLSQLLSGLSAIHAAGVVHRDVKPANLLLEPTGTGRPVLRIADFGIAAVIDGPRLTAAAVSIGTLGYMAPEQAQGAEPDPLQDIYSVGMVGKVMLTGLTPGNLPEQHPSALWPYLTWLSAPEARKRPRTAGLALEHLEKIGIPAGAPWQGYPDAPEVFDQLGPDPRNAEMPKATQAAQSNGSPASPLRSQAQPAAAPTQAWPPGQPVAAPTQAWPPGQPVAAPEQQWPQGQPVAAPTQAWPQVQPVAAPAEQRLPAPRSQSGLRILAIICFAGAAALLVAIVVILVRLS